MKDIVGYVVVSSVSWKRIDFGREKFLLKFEKNLLLFFFCPFFFYQSVIIFKGNWTSEMLLNCSTINLSFITM